MSFWQAPSGLRQRPWQRPIPAWLATGCFLAAITALAELSGLRLLLFPELGALTSVVFSDPAGRWARSPRLLVLTPLLSAVAGILVSRQLPYGPLSVLLAVAAGLLVLWGLRSPVAPALSAGYLPVALGIRSWTYPLAILLALSALAALAWLWRRHPAGLERVSSPLKAADPLVAPGECAAPVAPRGSDVRFPPGRRLLELALFLVGALALTRLLGSHLVLYPPLVVIAWETLAQPEHCPWRGRPLALLVATGSAAVVGLALARTLGPVPLAAFGAALLTGLLLNRLRLTCPPVYAVALLPLVLPQPPLALPLLVVVGGAWLVLVARGWPARWR